MTNGLYQKNFEHDACGVGFIAHMKGVKSHKIVAQGLEILTNLTHRGAVGADPLQGDGAGILIQIPDKLYRDDMQAQGVTLPPEGAYGVGMIFLPQESASRHACQEEIERAGKLPFTGIVNNANLGDETTPEIILEGLEFAEEVERASGLPVAFSAVRSDLTGGLKEKIKNILAVDPIKYGNW